jgi:outer membrane protein TolC
MSRHFFLGIVVAGLLSGRASAQLNESGQPPLTLRVAVAEALERNPELRALRSQYDAARAIPAQERYLLPPMLETQIWAWPLTTLNPARTQMYVFVAEQELPGRGKRAARTLVAERGAEMSRQQVAVRANEILGDLRQAFVDLGLARDLAGLYAGQRRLLEDMTEAATLRYVSGVGGQQYTVASLVELTRLENEIITAAERVQTAEAGLNTLLGRPAAQPIGPLASIEASVTVADAERIALARHPEFAMVDAAVAREEAEFARLQGERRPDFVIGGGYMLMPGDAGALTVRGGITWPNAPWSRGRLTSALDTQAKRVEAVKAQRDVVSARVRHAVRAAAIRVAAAERRLRLMQSTVLPQIEHALDVARVAYTGGAGAFIDVLESRRLLLVTQLEYAEARASVDRAFADLESAVGAGSAVQ